MDSKAFQDHLKTEHKQSVFSQYLKEIVYGGNDGIVTTFAVVAGFSGASLGASVLQFSFMSVLLFGLANMLADGAAMGLGNFLSVRSQKRVYEQIQNKELSEIHGSPEFEKSETVYLLKEKGYSDSDAEAMTQLFMKNDRFWAEFMMQYEHELPNPMGESALFNGLATFIAFVLFGFIPLIPYFVLRDVDGAFIYSCICTGLALAILGSLRAYVTKESYSLAVLETLAVGGVSSVVAFGVGLYFKV